MSGLVRTSEEIGLTKAQDELEGNNARGLRRNPGDLGTRVICQFLQVSRACTACFRRELQPEMGLCLIRPFACVGACAMLMS